TASMRPGATARSRTKRSIAASRTPAAAPRQPACTAAATRASRATSNTGTQSAVTTPTSRPRSPTTRPSASGDGSFAATVTTRVPCTCRGTTIGNGDPTRATIGGQSRPADSAPSRKPWRRSGVSCHGAWVSTPSLAAPPALRYLLWRGGAWGARTRPARPGGDAGRPRAARLGAPARLATRRHRPGPGSQRDSLELHVGVAEHLLERLPLVLVLVEDAADARVDEHLQAVDARRVRDVDVGVADRGAVLRRLRDRIDLGVDRAEAVLLDLAGRRPRRVDEAADVDAVRETRRRAVVAGREDVLVAHDHGPDLRSQARR